MAIQLSDHFTYKKLLRFVLPGILMMLFTSLYSIVDGTFVSNYSEPEAFTGLNFIYPVIGILGSVGFMIGAGGSALIGKTLGEGKDDLANRYFSLLVYITPVLAIVFAIPTYFLLPNLISAMGGNGLMADYALTYGRTLICFIPFFMLQMEFQGFFVTAEKPRINMLVTLICGVLNMSLDAIFIVGCKMNVLGAALGTGFAQIFGAIFPIIYFARKNNTSLLKLGKTKFEIQPILKTLGNGSSEFITNVAMSIMSMIYNYQLLKYIGNNGVSAYGVLMYVSLLYLSVFFGFNIGVAPIISFNYGAQNDNELHNVVHKYIVFFAICAVLMTASCYALATPLSKLFSGGSEELLHVTYRAFMFFALTFLTVPWSILGSNLFTSLNNGLISFLISIIRTFVCQIICVMVLPLILGSDGIWLSNFVGDTLALIPTLTFYFIYKKKYHY